jgi:hypothetical protein
MALLSVIRRWAFRDKLSIRAISRRAGFSGKAGAVHDRPHPRRANVAAPIRHPVDTSAHSWRHRMVDALLRERVPPEAADAITGHDNPRNAGAGYGRGFRGMPDELAKELRKMPAILSVPGTFPSDDPVSRRGRRRGRQIGPEGHTIIAATK